MQFCGGGRRCVAAATSSSCRMRGRLHHFGKKALLGIFQGYTLCGGIWKEDVMVVDIEELGNLAASEIHARRLQCEEGLHAEKLRKCTRFVGILRLS